MLIIREIIVMNQMHYMRNTDLGFSKEQSMIVRLDNNAIWEKKIQFKNELQQELSISNVSLMSGEPGGFHDSYGFEAESKPGEKLMLNTDSQISNTQLLWGLK